jgi:hypothetical protein
MRPTLRSCLLLALAALLLSAGKPTLAADPVGSWAVDTAALRGELERLMRADIARMPAAQRPQTEAVLPGRLDHMAHRSAGTAEFRPDGTVLLEDHLGQRRTGRWSLEGDRVRLLSEDEPPYAGTLEGDVMRLEPEGEAEPAPALVLRRR